MLYNSTFNSSNNFNYLIILTCYFNNISIRFNSNSTFYINIINILLFFLPLTSTAYNKNYIFLGKLGRVDKRGRIINKPLVCKCTY